MIFPPRSRTSRRDRRRAVIAVAGALWALALCVARVPAQVSLSLRWAGYGHDPQHTAQSSTASQPLQRIKWSTPVDLNPQYNGNDLFIHYGSALITGANTVIVPVKTGATDGFRVEGRRGANGTLLWTANTDYVLPPHGWTPSYGIALSPRNVLYFPAAGGVINYRNNPDATTSTGGSLVFYGKDNFDAAPATYRNVVRICTPITSDRYGNLFFGYYVTGTNPIGLKSGLARISYNGVGTFVTASAAAGDSGISRVAYNCTPALSNDHRTLYVAVSGGGDFGTGYLLALDSWTLETKAKVRLKDVLSPSNDAYIVDDGTASPTVGPDGDVYYGVLENPFGTNHARGWLLHFSSDLKTKKTPGSFGWDDSASVVPSSMVPSYHGTSSYLLMTKYNNYAEGGGDGVNRVAILDPKASQVSPISGATVMREVLTIAGPTPDSEFLGSLPHAVREWCINTAAVDPATKSILVNNEDGKLYRWDLTTNKLTQPVTLTDGVGEAYTPTIIGVDGTVYAINNATLFAVGK
jgi:hypothetical protein